MNDVDVSYILEKSDPHQSDTYTQGFGKKLLMAFGLHQRKQWMMLEAMETMASDCVQLCY